MDKKLYALALTIDLGGGKLPLEITTVQDAESLEKAITLSTENIAKKAVARGLITSINSVIYKLHSFLDLSEIFDVNMDGFEGTDKILNKNKEPEDNNLIYDIEKAIGYNTKLEVAKKVLTTLDKKLYSKNKKLFSEEERKYIENRLENKE